MSTQHPSQEETQPSTLIPPLQPVQQHGQYAGRYENWRHRRHCAHGRSVSWELPRDCISWPLVSEHCSLSPLPPWQTTPTILVWPTAHVVTRTSMPLSRSFHLYVCAFSKSISSRKIWPLTGTRSPFTCCFAPHHVLFSYRSPGSRSSATTKYVISQSIFFHPLSPQRHSSPTHFPILPQGLGR